MVSGSPKQEETDFSLVSGFFTCSNNFYERSLEMKWFLSVLLVSIFLAATANAATINYGWEDGETILGSYSSITATNDTTVAHSGASSLKLVDGGASGTPQAFVGWVTGLNDGDTVTAGFWVYDTTPGSSPSGRIWGHYTSDDTDIDSYAGSASGNSSYGDVAGWSYLEYEWSFAAGTDRTGLVIEARTYSGLGDTIWVDDLMITAPDHATISPSAVPVPAAVWLLGSGLLGLIGIRRKKA
jgi:hypothetical protein